MFTRQTAVEYIYLASVAKVKWIYVEQYLHVQEKTFWACYRCAFDKQQSINLVSLFNILVLNLAPHQDGDSDVLRNNFMECINCVIRIALK